MTWKRVGASAVVPRPRRWPSVIVTVDTRAKGGRGTITVPGCVLAAAREEGEAVGVVCAAVNNAWEHACGNETALERTGHGRLLSRVTLEQQGDRGRQAAGHACVPARCRTVHARTHMIMVREWTLMERVVESSGSWARTRHTASHARADSRARRVVRHVVVRSARVPRHAQYLR